MERLATQNRWQSFRWQALGVVPDDRSREARAEIAHHPTSLHVLYPGFVARVHSDEAEGYYLNVTAPEPRVFVMWRIPEDNPEDAVPHSVTLSYNEAARWMDAQEKVDGVAMPDDIFAALCDWVAVHYRPPEKKRRIRPQSFESKEGRYRGGMDS
jgi:hypothetical protein